MPIISSSEHMFLHVLKVKYLDHYRLYLEFSNGVKGAANLEKALWGDVFLPLKENVELFKTAYVDPILNTVTWQNGVDFAPEFLLSCVEKSQSV